MLPSEDLFPGSARADKTASVCIVSTISFFVERFRGKVIVRKDFVEPAFFGVQFFDLPMFSRRELSRWRRPVHRAPNYFLEKSGPRRAIHTASSGVRRLLNSLSFIFTAAASPFAIRTVTAPACADFCFSSAGVPLATIRPRVDDDGARTNRFDLLQNVGRKNDRLFLAHLPDQGSHFVFLVGIQSVGRLVEDQDLGIVNDRLRKTGAMTIAFRQRLDALVQNGTEKTHLDHAIDRARFLRSAKTAQLAAKVKNPRTVMSL